MIFQTHDIMHPNQTRLNTLIDHYDRAYLNSQSSLPLDHFISINDDAVDMNDVIAFRTHYDRAH